MTPSNRTIFPHGLLVTVGVLSLVPDSIPFSVMDEQPVRACQGIAEAGPSRSRKGLYAGKREEKNAWLVGSLILACMVSEGKPGRAISGEK